MKKLPKYSDEYGITSMSAHEIHQEASGDFNDSWVIRHFLMLEGGLGYLEEYKDPELMQECKDLMGLYEKVEKREESILEKLRLRVMKDHEVIHPGCTWWREVDNKDSKPYPNNIVTCHCSSEEEWDDSDWDGDMDDWDGDMDDNDHVGCFSYPNCDIDPNGCVVLNGKDAEPYGHR
jgi:hypothetical protein